MSDVDDYDDDADEPKPSKGNALREQNSKLASEKADLEKRLNDLLQKDRARTIADALREKGANPKLAKYVARDLEGEVTDESVAKWLEEEGELFGYTAGSDEDDADAVQQQRISDASATAPQSQTGFTPERIKQMSHAELIQAGLLDP